MELSSSKIKKVSYISGNGTLNFLRSSPKNKNIHPEKNFLYLGKWNFLQSVTKYLRLTLVSM